MKFAIALCLLTTMLYSSGCADRPITIQAAPADSCAWLKPLYLSSATETALRAGLARAREAGDADALLALRLDIKAIADQSEAILCICRKPAQRPATCPQAAQNGDRSE